VLVQPQVWLAEYHFVEVAVKLLTLAAAPHQLGGGTGESPTKDARYPAAALNPWSRMLPGGLGEGEHIAVCVADPYVGGWMCCAGW
jgi:hypothetical protein